MPPEKPDPRRYTQAVKRFGDLPDSHGFVNPPLHRGSTVRFDTLEDYERSLDVDLKDGPYTYGLLGTPVERELEDALARMEEGFGSVLLGSGLAAVGVALLSYLKTGDHLLMVDACYTPSRIICTERLSALGIETTFYPPNSAPEEVATLIRPNTRVLFMESPGSLTFEVQDVPGLVRMAKRHGLVTIADNTWATPLLFNPIKHGVDVVVHALTKYVAGHSDVMLGALVASNREHWDRLKHTAMDYGHGASPDDAWLGLRGMRSLPTRLAQCARSALQVAAWLEQREEVLAVLHPSFASCPGHEFWQRDFGGAAGLFSVILGPLPRIGLESMIEGMRHFGLGYSWGGYESLMLPFNPKDRSNQLEPSEGVGLRLSIGLEYHEDLISDLGEGLNRLSQ
ncbi:MAG: cystathionine beta-lyase [Planctomycetota bacterium]|nr:cystathionine beta-lyase [Planctomycetota bacterium]